MTEEDGEELHRRGVLYAPDYLINAGGVINASTEIGADYNPDLAREKTERIYEIMGRIARESKEGRCPPPAWPTAWPEERLASVRAIKPIHRGPLIQPRRGRSPNLAPHWRLHQ